MPFHWIIDKRVIRTSTYVGTNRQDLVLYSAKDEDLAEAVQQCVAMVMIVDMHVEFM